MVLRPLIYRGKKQDGKKGELGEKGKGRERAGEGKGGGGGCSPLTTKNRDRRNVIE